MYECETWSTTQGDEKKLLTFGRKVFRIIHCKCTYIIFEWVHAEWSLPSYIFIKIDFSLVLKSSRSDTSIHVIWY